MVQGSANAWEDDRDHRRHGRAGVVGCAGVCRSEAHGWLSSDVTGRCRIARSRNVGESNAAKLVGDAADPATADRAVELAVERFGRLDGLYHVAGGSGRSQGDGPLHEIS